MKVLSRIGIKPVAIPAGVEVKLGNDNVLSVKGPKGSLTKQFHKSMAIKIEDNQVSVGRPSDEKYYKALHGLTRSLINNMIAGITEGFQKLLEINGVGYRAQKQGHKLVLFLGYSSPVEMEPPEGIVFEVPAPNKILVKGADKELVGELAAQIKAKRPPEPYKGKGVKYEGEVIRRKEGKAGVKK